MMRIVILFSMILYAMPSIGQTTEYIGSYRINDETEHVLNLFKIDEELLMVKDSISSLGVIDDNSSSYLQRWAQNNVAIEGENLFFLYPNFVGQLKKTNTENGGVLDSLDYQSTDKSYKLKKGGNELRIASVTVFIDPVIYQCVKPKEHNQAHFDESIEYLKHKYKCTSFKVKD